MSVVVVVTGLPGVGKTTLVQKVVKQFSADTATSGFVTAELRDEASNTRTGFEVITLAGMRAPLAVTGVGSGPRVGKYLVKVPEFEAAVLSTLGSAVLPTLGSAVLSTLGSAAKLIVIDEVGKMESFSRRFMAAVAQLLATPGHVLLVTLPEKGRTPLANQLCAAAGDNVFTVTRGNREDLCSTVVTVVQRALREL